VKIPVTKQIVTLVPTTMPRSKLLLSFTFLSHSDIQFGVQEIVLTRTTAINALKQLLCDWLIR